MGAGPTCCIHRPSWSSACIHRVCRGAGHHAQACTILSVSEHRRSDANDKEASCAQRSHCPPPATSCSTRRSPAPMGCTAHLDGSTIGASPPCWPPTCAMGGIFAAERCARRSTEQRPSDHRPPARCLPHRRTHPRRLRHSRATARRTRQHRHRTRPRIRDHRTHRISHRRGVLSELSALADTCRGPRPRR